MFYHWTTQPSSDGTFSRHQRFSQKNERWESVSAEDIGVSGNVEKPLVRRGTVPPVLYVVGSPVAAPQQEVSKIK